MKRRTFIAGAAAAMLASQGQAMGGTMFGLIVKMSAKPGQRDALIALMTGDPAAIAGCISFIVAKDAVDENAIWITEVWESEASHAASLKIPAVAASIAKAMPLIDVSAGIVQQKTMPVGGLGLGR